MDLPEVGGPVTVTKDVTGEVSALSVICDSVGRPVAGLTVDWPVDVAARLGKG